MGLFDGRSQEDADRDWRFSGQSPGGQTMVGIQNQAAAQNAYQQHATRTLREKYAAQLLAIETERAKIEADMLKFAILLDFELRDLAHISR